MESTLQYDIIISIGGNNKINEIHENTNINYSSTLTSWDVRALFHDVTRDNLLQIFLALRGHDGVLVATHHQSS